MVATKVTIKTSQTLAVLFLSRNQVKYCHLELSNEVSKSLVYSVHEIFGCVG